MGIACQQGNQTICYVQAAQLRPLAAGTFTKAWLETQSR